MIPKSTEADILRFFHAEKWPIGTIATELGIHHTTVQRVLRQSGVEPVVVAPRPSVVDPYMPFVQEQLAKYPKLRASRLFSMIKDRGYPGKQDHFRRIVGRIRPKKPAEAFLRLRTLPGEQAQVDWASFGKMRIGHHEREHLAASAGAEPPKPISLISPGALPASLSAIAAPWIDWSAPRSGASRPSSRAPCGPPAKNPAPMERHASRPKFGTGHGRPGHGTRQSSAASSIPPPANPRVTSSSGCPSS